MQRTKELQEANERLKGDITERKRAADALRRADNRFTESMDHLLEGCQIIGFDWRFLYLNDAAASQGRQPKEAFLGRPMWEVLPGIGSTELFAVLRRCMEERQPQSMVNEFTYADGDHGWFELRVQPVEEGLFILSIDITERKRTQAMLEVRMDLLQYAMHHSLGEVLQKTLDEVGLLVDSPIGFYHFVGEDRKTLTLQAWSTRTEREFCKAEGKGSHYAVDKAGVWADCICQRRPVIHNDYPSLPHRKGLPEGHVAVICELVVPILRHDQVVAILGVGNKPQNYTDADVKLVTYLADMAWEIAEHSGGMMR